jgi:hypothetical protein
MLFEKMPETMQEKMLREDQVHHEDAGKSVANLTWASVRASSEVKEKSSTKVHANL